MVPLPPMMLTPPSTTMAMVSMSQPRAMLGRVAPMREVRNAAATPHMAPFRVKNQKR